MPKAVIPKDIYAGFQMRSSSKNQPSADGGKHVALAFLTYRNEHDKLQHQESFDRWRDTDIPRIPFDNAPTTGMMAIGFASRYSNSNKLIRIEDPRNFQVEITVENFIDIIKKVEMKNGVIQDELVWGWCGGLTLYKVGEDDYLEAKANFEYGGSPTIPVKSVGLGSEVILANGKRGYYYGGWHIIDVGWRSDLDPYFEGEKGVGVKSKRYHFIKFEDGHFEKWASIQIKNVFVEDDLGIEAVREELNSEIEFSIKRAILCAKAKAEMVRLDIPLNDYKFRDDREKVYNQFGLSDGGYSVIGNEEKRWTIFRRMYALNDKPIKQDWFEEMINKELAKY